MRPLALILVLFAASAFADEININRVDGTFSRHGGEFNSRPLDPLSFIGGVPALNDLSFQTFCLEQGEYVDMGGVYDFEINTGAVEGGISGQTIPGFDPLDPLTAYMYECFVRGTLVGYNYGPDREASAAALQNAIWYVEGEVPFLDAGLANDFWHQAVDAAPTDIGGVRVLNLFKDGVHKQDQIFMHAPEPAGVTLLLIGGLLLLFMVIMRGARK